MKICKICKFFFEDTREGYYCVFLEGKKHPVTGKELFQPCHRGNYDNIDYDELRHYPKCESINPFGECVKHELDEEALKKMEEEREFEKKCLKETRELYDKYK